MIEIFFRYLHFIGILLIASALTAEYILINSEMSRRQIRQLTIADAIYGISALTVLGAGVTLWLFVGKPPSFYSTNILFIAKVSLFVIIGLMSITPSRFIRKLNTSTDSSVTTPKKIRLLIIFQMTLLPLLPLLAVLMARGYGLN